jgi:hypothetical protein
MILLCNINNYVSENHDIQTHRNFKDYIMKTFFKRLLARLEQHYTAKAQEYIQKGGWV